MEIDKAFWKKSFYVPSEFRELRCPYCLKKGFSFDNAEFAKKMDPETKDRSEQDPSYPEEQENYDVAIVLACNGCFHNTFIVGNFGSTPIHSTAGPQRDYEDLNWEAAVKIKAAIPYLPIFEIPEGTPDEVQKEIKKAFGHYFYDTGSCGNRIRTSLEALMDKLKVPKYRTGKPRKRSNLLLLGDRIKEFGASPSNSDLAKHIEAIKWIGNAGTHGDELERDDLLDGFELLLHVLDTLYRRPTLLKNLMKKSKEINQRKKPLNTKR